MSDGEGARRVVRGVVGAGGVVGEEAEGAREKRWVVSWERRALALEGRGDIAMAVVAAVGSRGREEIAYIVGSDGQMEGVLMTRRQQGTQVMWKARCSSCRSWLGRLIIGGHCSNVVSQR